MKKMKKIIALLLIISVMCGFSIVSNAAGNVVYTNGTEGSNWPYSSGYVNTITLSGATVKNYVWSGNTCDVVFTSDTPQDAEITFTLAYGGRITNKVSSEINGISGASGVVTLENGTATVSVYSQFMMASMSGTKTFNLSIAEENNLPTLADSTNSSTTATVTGTEVYSINLAELFTDADAADTLTYNVSVNGADAVSAEVDEMGIYTYPTKFAGTYELVFTATDSKGDTSADTYTATITVVNSDVTYDATVKIPGNITPVFKLNAGFNADGTPIDGEALDVKKASDSEGMTSYVVSVPENVSTINVGDGTRKMAVDVDSETAVSMRNTEIIAKDMFGNEVEASVKATYGDGNAAVGDGNKYLLATGIEYTMTATPTNTTNYKAATNKQTLQAGSDTAKLEAAIDYNNLKTITAPTGAAAKVFSRNNYYSYKEHDSAGVKDNNNGTSTFYFPGATSSDSPMMYRVAVEGKITKAGYWAYGETNKTVSYSENDLEADDRVNYSEQTTNNSGIAEDSVLLNVNSKNFLKMSVGNTKTLKAYRAWELVENYMNHIITPDFNYEIVWESTDNVVSLNHKDSPSAGGDGKYGDWRILKAVNEGTAIIEVTFNSVLLSGGSYDGIYGATDPARTGLLVVQVGGNSANVNFGIDGKASQGSMIYANSTPKVWDAEFDTLYFTGDSGKLDFSPTVTSGTIQKVEVSNDKGKTWTTLSTENGIYTATITSGNNIIKVITSEGTDYQVVRGDKVSYTVEEVTASEKNINDNDGIIEAGETVRVTIDGLHSPIPKMSGNYNPGYMANLDGDSGHHLSYSMDGLEYKGTKAQYNWLTAANYIDVTLPETAGEHILEDGYIALGVIGLTSFADGGDSHRNIPDAGASTRDSKTTFHTRSVLPDITIAAASNDKLVSHGDVNADNEINAKDATLVLKYATGKIASDKLKLDVADVNGDDIVNAKDATLILKFAAEKITSFPAEGKQAE